MADLAPEDYLRFVCVETANAGEGPIEIAPGATHKLSATICAELFDANGKPVAARSKA